VVEIASLFSKHGDNLLERNIRKYLGLNKNRINNNIKETLLGDSLPYAIAQTIILLK
jgi:hypothetical protein